MSEEPHILIVEDEAAICEMLQFALHKAGYTAEAATDVRQAQILIYNRKPDLILLDWMLPTTGGIVTNGIEFAQQLKNNSETQQIPIIMLTAKSGEADKVRGLEVGADDYVTKPFSPRELVARIKAVLRRTLPYLETELLKIDKLQLDPVRHRVSVGEQEVQIGPTEFRLLHFFMRNPERVYSRTQLLDQIWGNQVYIEERTVDVHILRLRKALALHEYDYLIQTIRSVGYRLSNRDT